MSTLIHVVFARRFNGVQQVGIIELPIVKGYIPRYRAERWARRAGVAHLFSSASRPAALSFYHGFADIIASHQEQQIEKQAA